MAEDPESPVTGREIAVIVGRSLFYFAVLVAVLVLWRGTGLFLYEGF